MAEVAPAPAAKTPAPELDEVMLAMDVVDTLRHQEKLVERELGQDTRDEALKARLRKIYEGQGLDVTDRILEQGIVALKESRFVYSPPKPGFDTFLAKLWVRRGVVGSVVGILVLVLAVFVTWQVWQGNQVAREAEAQRIELTETLPARLKDAGEAMLAVAESAEARTAAEELIADGEIAVAAQDAAGMRAAIDGLQSLRADLLQTFTLTIVSRDGEDTGVFRIPDVNEGTRNYYIVVEALTDSGEALSRSVRNEETGKIATVSKWGVRVPESTFEAIRDDKLDDGIVQNNILGEKRRGGLAVDYRMPVDGGAITEW